jgi:outer membrane protein W
LLLVRTTLFLGCALALMAQSDAPQANSTPAPSDEEYSGPAILSRGETPGAQTAAPIAFRPYIGIAGIYDTGLVPVSLTSTGQIPSTDLYGLELNLGAYTYHVWKHTTLGLDYRGDFREYTTSYWDGTDQLLSLILTHQPGKRVTFTLRNQAGIYSLSDYSLSSPLAGVDPNYLALPQNDIYDNRVIFAGVSADLTYHLTHRLSFSLGGQGSLVRRQSTALYGMTGGAARGDLEYRASRHTTLGADFRFTYFDYTRGFGNTTVSSVGLNYSTQLSPHVQMSARIGGARVQSTSLTEVTLDPALAALLGESESIQAAYRLNYVPDMEIRLTDSFRRSLFTLAYLNDVTPGNGVYLTSRNNSGNASYSYTGVRHWNFGVNGTYGRMTALVQTVGAYTAYGAGIGITRDLAKGLHTVLRLDSRHYDISSAVGYLHTEYRASLGLNFSPGDVPLVLW